jgi:acetyl-CoA carboxylase alpha subunit
MTTHMSRALTYNETQVRLVRAAIAEAVQGAHSATQSSAGTTNSYTRHSLAELRNLEAHYLAAVNAERGGSVRQSVRPDFGDCK